MKERSLDFKLIYENPWEKRDEFMEINPVGQVPVLIDNNYVLTDSNSICEYLEENYKNTTKLFGSSIAIKSRVRGLIS